MAKKKSEGYLSARESRRISKENRRITNAFEKQRKRKNVPESEYLTQMRDPNNAVEFDNLHTYFSVSYTHLDVYKRQPMRRDTLSPPGPTGTGCPWNTFGRPWRAARFTPCPWSFLPSLGRMASSDRTQKNSCTATYPAP